MIGIGVDIFSLSLLLLSSMWFVCLVAWVEVNLLLSRATRSPFLLVFKNWPLTTRSLSAVDVWCVCVAADAAATALHVCACARARACMQRREGRKREENDNLFLPRHAVQAPSRARTIREYLWVMVGGQKKEEENAKRREWRRMPADSFFSSIEILPFFFFSLLLARVCDVPFSATTLLAVGHNSISLSSHRVVYYDILRKLSVSYTQCQTEGRSWSNQKKKKLRIHKQCHSYWNDAARRERERSPT